MENSIAASKAELSSLIRNSPVNQLDGSLEWVVLGQLSIDDTGKNQFTSRLLSRLDDSVLEFASRLKSYRVSLLPLLARALQFVLFSEMVVETGWSFAVVVQSLWVVLHRKRPSPVRRVSKLSLCPFAVCGRRCGFAWVAFLLPGLVCEIFPNNSLFSRKESG